MKVLLPGGTGHVGRVLQRAFLRDGHEVVVLTRRPGASRAVSGGAREVAWDARTAGPWTREVDGCDVIVNLAGRSVSCRYTPANLREMMNSRVDSARVVGEAVAAAANPPRLWLQMSTATIYAHRYDAPHDEASGVIGGTESGVPGYWAYSVEIAKAWEAAQSEADTPRTRKVALRAAMVMSPERGSVFDVLSRLARLGLGGPVAGGRQYVSWIHEDDFVRALRFLIDRDDLSGPVNLAAPDPLPQRAFMRALRGAWSVPVGLPATRWMAALGAYALRSDTELLLKSRRVVPGRLTAAGFAFDHGTWPRAAADLVRAARLPRAVAGTTG
ncbi:TIGR01777 family oxidoreductase [Streptomyces sp. 8L]|uniref:TIGR01777 family oxidoreductase n=1 Tax=Streptomyces sp. 8L TaxID=2877242 RepID=UPI001CD63FEB|nr:TIGR01777 family oxidoreductase [Streptomyces sp. 8L]MCA1218302.1 TIGR01777 family oxidoreductase [Streptomyces sp. 8L]